MSGQTPTGKAAVVELFVQFARVKHATFPVGPYYL